MRRWQTLFWISVTVLAVVSLAGALAGPAIAQIRAAVVKNIDEKGRIAFQASAPCVGVVQFPTIPPSTCSALFPVVPANKRLVIEYVGGEINTTSDFTPAAAIINTTTETAYPLLTFPRFSRNYGISSPILMYVDAGQRVVMTGFGPSGVGHIAGYLVDLAQ